jgi:hypothetical protein
MSLFNRRRAHAPTYPDPSAGGLDSVIWEVLCDIVTAVKAGTPDEFLEALNRFADRLSIQSQRLCGYYIYSLLKIRLQTMLGVAPNDAQLDAVASSARPRFRLFLPSEASSLEDVLRTPFGLQRSEIEGARYTFCAFAALGALLDDPARELEAMRPALDAWCAKGAATIRRVCEQLIP